MCSSDLVSLCLAVVYRQPGGSALVPVARVSPGALRTCPLCAEQAVDSAEKEATRIITCGACKAVYAIDMEMLGKGAGSKVRCEVCGNIWFQSASRVNTLFDGFELEPYDAEKAKTFEASASGNAPPPKRVSGAATLFVANLPFSFGDRDLEDLFADCGPLASATIVLDEGGRSRGFGFVDVVKEADAQPAIDKLNGADVSHLRKGQLTREVLASKRPLLLTVRPPVGRPRKPPSDKPFEAGTPSVVLGRHLLKSGMPEPPPPSLVQSLAASGIFIFGIGVPDRKSVV